MYNIYYIGAQNSERIEREERGWKQKKKTLQRHMILMENRH